MGLRVPELLIIGFVFGLVLFLLPAIFFLRSVATSLGQTRRHHGVAPGLAYLALIPIFSMGWQFYLLINVTKGVKGRYGELGWNPGDAGYGLGLTACILNVAVGFLNVLLSRTSAGPALVALLGLGGLIVWIVYWVKLSGFNKQLAMVPPAGAYPPPPGYPYAPPGAPGGYPPPGPPPPGWPQP
jgi:hypothetical protein